MTFTRCAGFTARRRALPDRSCSQISGTPRGAPGRGPVPDHRAPRVITLFSLGRWSRPLPSSLGRSFLASRSSVVRRRGPATRPLELFGQDVEDGFAGQVAVALVGQQDEAGGAAGALDRLVEALGLDRERARVAVLLAVDEQDRRADLVRVAERR